MILVSEQPQTAAAEAMVSPPLKWHGGKHYLAPHIHRIARRASYCHRVITHAGGLGELWGWEHEGFSEVANDINGWLTNFWDVLRDPQAFEQLKRFLEATPCSEAMFLAARDVIDATPLRVTASLDRVTAAAWFFVVCRQSMAGRMQSFTPLSRTRTRRGMNELPSAWLTAIEGLPEAHARLKRVVILNKDAPQVVRQQDGPRTLFYCDPPYLPDTRTAPDVYRAEMTPDQHQELLETLRGIRGHFILSGYDNKLYRQWEAHGRWRREEIPMANHAASGKEKREMVEVLWSNF
jgi:DNA adenine methylase